MEEVVVEVDPDYQGSVMEAIGERKAEMRDVSRTSAGTVRLEFLMATRALMGLRNELLMVTRGTAIMYQNFYQYMRYKGELSKKRVGVLVSMSGGRAVAYALWGLEKRGEIMVFPGADLYEGMIVGVNNKGSDLVVNATRGKQLTNIRAAGSDEAIQLTPPREITLEFALEFIEKDELVEITPMNIRLRKTLLTEVERKRASRAAKGKS